MCGQVRVLVLGLVLEHESEQLEQEVAHRADRRIHRDDPAHTTSTFASLSLCISLCIKSTSIITFMEASCIVRVRVYKYCGVKETCGAFAVPFGSQRVGHADAALELHAESARVTVARESIYERGKAHARRGKQTHAQASESNSRSESESRRAARESRRPQRPTPTKGNSYALRATRDEKNEKENEKDARAAYRSKGKSNIVSYRTERYRRLIVMLTWRTHTRTRARGYRHCRVCVMHMKILKLSAVASAAAVPYGIPRAVRVRVVSCTRNAAASVARSLRTLKPADARHETRRRGGEGGAKEGD